jgi:hypothetical protein
MDFSIAACQLPWWVQRESSRFPEVSFGSNSAVRRCRLNVRITPRAVERDVINACAAARRAITVRDQATLDGLAHPRPRP